MLLKCFQNILNLIPSHCVSFFIEIFIEITVDSQAAVRNNSEIPYTVYLNGNFLQDYSTTSQLGYSHWYIPSILLWFPQFYLHCVCGVQFCIIPSHVNLCIHHHSQHTAYFCHHKDPWHHRFTPPLFPSWSLLTLLPSLTTGNDFSFFQF